MAGSVVPVVVLRALDSAGNPLSGALLQVYLTGTTTPSPFYTSSSLATPLSNPVVADSTGSFPPMFADPAITYRTQIKTAGGVLLPSGDVDPAVRPFTPAAGSITSGMLAAGVAVASLGFTPLNKAGDTATGELIIGYTMSAPPDAKSVGFRGMPTATQFNQNYTFGPDDGGRMFRHTDASAYTWTIPLNVTIPWKPGTIISCRNFGSGIITIARTGGVFLRLAGSSTNQNVSLAQNAMGALIMEDTDNWIWSGTGGS